MFTRNNLNGPVLAVSSPGGHWRQLLQLSDAWKEENVLFVTPRQCDLDEAGVNGITVPDASRSDIRGMLRLAWATLQIVRRHRPSVVISTGAAPGLLTIFFGRMFGARTVWIDSVANVGRVSLSGRIAGRLTDHWLTQWKHLARPAGPVYLGGLL